MSQSKEMVKRADSNPMEKLEDLLPGIEEFLCSVLARETLSSYAEEQRQYFLERLDIIKMPPSVPPRPTSLGVNLFPMDISPMTPSHSSIPSIEQEDFAAYQREISRALIDPDATSETTEVKVYDDIDPTDLSVSDVGNATHDEDSMYEIPQLKRSLSESGYEKAIDLSVISKAASSDNILAAQQAPPPLPPRKERTMSDATIRSSIGSMLDEATQDLIHKATTPIRQNALDNRSQRSSDDLLDGNIDMNPGVSCDSIDEAGYADTELDILHTTDVQLPQSKVKKKKSTRRKLGVSLSSLKESTISFRALEGIELTGELHYRSKLTWTKKMVALTNGRLVCYKADKPESRPSHIILLNGYHAALNKRDGKHGVQINLHHDMFESHTFLSDFKEWADIWCEHINAASDGKKAPGPLLHLVRGSSIGASREAEYSGTLTKINLDSSSSNLSLASSEGFDGDPGTVKVKRRDGAGIKTARMGNFAFRASQFFESLGKKSNLRKSISSDVYRDHKLSASLSSLSETPSPLTPESGILEEMPAQITKHIKHQGYLDIYSSFNKRKWGKRWCMVHENSFECYRTQTSEVCELEFLLRNCVLRRAIEETKSEMGLMLTENNREKITIEPINWTELGSWLRVLMQETSTPTVPDGLQGYMDDTNPYHEAVEITRLSDPFPASPPAVRVSPARERTAVTNDSEDEDHRQSTPNRNRDSGNCSAESMFGSLERKSREAKTHPCYTDSSLPRVSVNGSGDIYTQVRKSSKASLHSENQSNPKNRTVTSDAQQAMDRFDYDFSTTVPSMRPGASLMDEIMLQFNSQLSAKIENEKDVFTFDENKDRNGDINRNLRKSIDRTEKLSEIESIISPIKDSNNSEVDLVAASAQSVLCSSFISESGASETNDNQSKQLDVPITGTVESKTDNADSDKPNCDSQSKKIKGACKENGNLAGNKVERSESVARKRSSVGYDPATVEKTLEELRTRLVQLKKDRISIRDRKQMITSEINREYLDAEFNRLNRECQKVQEEINYLDKLKALDQAKAQARCMENSGESKENKSDENQNNLEDIESVRNSRIQNETDVKDIQSKCYKSVKDILEDSNLEQKESGVKESSEETPVDKEMNDSDEHKTESVSQLETETTVDQNINVEDEAKSKVDGDTVLSANIEKEEPKEVQLTEKLADLSANCSVDCTSVDSSYDKDVMEGDKCCEKLGKEITTEDFDSILQEIEVCDEQSTSTAINTDESESEVEINSDEMGNSHEQMNIIKSPNQADTEEEIVTDKKLCSGNTDESENEVEINSDINGDNHEQINVAETLIEADTDTGKRFMTDKNLLEVPSSSGRSARRHKSDNSEGTQESTSDSGDGVITDEERVFSVDSETNGLICDLSTDFESKLTIHSSESD